MNFNIDLYSPNFMKTGIDTSGIKKNIHKFEFSLSDQISPKRRANESHTEKIKKNTSAVIITAFLF